MSNILKSILLSNSKKEFALGEQICLEVKYQNIGNISFTFRDPAKTWEVMLEVVNLSDSSTQRLPFGKIISKIDTFGIRSEAQEPADDITIKPQEYYQFSPPIYKQHMNIFGPGIYQMKVIDCTNDDETVISNVMDITIEAKKVSFEYLITICSDDNQSIDNREFAVRWIKEIFPDFAYKLEDSTEKEKMLNEKMIEKSIEWWRRHKDNSDVSKNILSINTRAGIVPKK